MKLDAVQGAIYGGGADSHEKIGLGPGLDFPAARREAFDGRLLGAVRAQDTDARELQPQSLSDEGTTAAFAVGGIVRCNRITATTIATSATTEQWHTTRDKKETREAGEACGQLPAVTEGSEEEEEDNDCEDCGQRVVLSRADGR